MEILKKAYNKSKYIVLIKKKEIHMSFLFINLLLLVET